MKPRIWKVIVGGSCSECEASRRQGLGTGAISILPIIIVATSRVSPSQYRCRASATPVLRATIDAFAAILLSIKQDRDCMECQKCDDRKGQRRNCDHFMIEVLKHEHNLTPRRNIARIHVVSKNLIDRPDLY